ncbi:MAG: ABC transporter ATP-binding protein [Geminicoccaceae bacterium]
MTLLELADVGKRYGAVTALADISLAVARGGRTAIVGPSGSGKTTLLRLVAGFEAPDAGRIRLDGALLADGPAIVPVHRRGIGVVQQDGALFPHLSVAENIGFGLERHLPHRSARIAELMELVELERAMLTRRPHELSGGQQQRVALARALARRPQLVLLDEPFSALDAGLREAMRNAVAKVLATAGTTSILVTHDQAEALSFADQVAVLRAGRLVQAGSPRELYLRPLDPATAAFLGEAIVLPAELGDGWAACSLGRIAADTGSRRGPAEILLRPEQLRLEPATATDKDEDEGWVLGQVVEVTFAGAVCTVTVAVAGLAPTLPAARIPVRGASFALPAPGATVRVAVAGPAHVFAAPVPVTPT